MLVIDIRTRTYVIVRYMKGKKGLRRKVYFIIKSGGKKNSGFVLILVFLRTYYACHFRSNAFVLSICHFYTEFIDLLSRSTKDLKHTFD